MKVRSSEQPKSDQVVEQALSGLFAYITTHAFPYGQSAEQYVTLPPESADTIPEIAVMYAMPELSSPYALMQPEYRSFTMRSVESGEVDYYKNAHRLVMDGFRAQKKGSWMYYTPEGQEPFRTTGRTYVTLPADGTATESLLAVSECIEGNLARPGIDMKVTNKLNERHSIVIYNDATEQAQEGILDFVDELQARKVSMSNDVVLTAAPIAPGVAQAPEVPGDVQAYYRQITGDTGMSWSQLAGLALKISTQYALRDEKISSVADQPELQEVALQRAKPVYAKILQSFGIDPLAYSYQR